MGKEVKAVQIVTGIFCRHHHRQHVKHVALVLCGVRLPAVLICSEKWHVCEVILRVYVIVYFYHAVN